MTDRKTFSREAHPKSEVDIYPINKDYRFRRHVLQCELGGVEIWNLGMRRMDRGEEVWRFVANDRSPIRLGNYCAARNIMPDPENAELLSSLAYR